MGSRVIAYFGPATGERCMEQHPCKDPGLPGQALQLGPHPSIAPRRGSRGSRTRLPEGVHGIIHLREQNGSLLLLLLKALLGHQSCPVLHPLANMQPWWRGVKPGSMVQRSQITFMDGPAPAAAPRSIESVSEAPLLTCSHI